MITSTSINAAFITKLVHATNIAIACESYCEVFTSKGKRSVLVEWDAQKNSLRFTHISGQDVTSLCWEAIKGFVVLPSEAIKPVQKMADELGEEENKSYGFVLGYLLFVFMGLLVAFQVVSLGSAVLAGALVVIGYRVVAALVDKLYRNQELVRVEPSLG